MPDFVEPVGLNEDISIYFDDLYLNNDPTPGSAPFQEIENFEPITMNAMLGGSADSSYFSLGPNPLLGGINSSVNVGEYYRDKDGIPWGGFWSALASSIDITDNKYIHVKVYKPRISPLRFKIEGGAAGNHEVSSMLPQEKINEWEDMVFDFSSKSGTYPTIVFMPDYMDPVGLAEDNVIYFDDIELNNDPAPRVARAVEFNVDMRSSGFTVGESVFISGDFDGIWGIWSEPGYNMNNQMFDPDNDSIYSITLNLLEGVYEFKFFKGDSWAGGEWSGGPNRVVNINSDKSVNCIWGFMGFVDIKEQTTPVNFSVYPVPFDDYLTFRSDSDISLVTISSMSGQELLKYESIPPGQVTVGPLYLPNGMYILTSRLKTGEQKTIKLIRSK